jgi:aminoacylase
VDARISPNLGTEAFSKLLTQWTSYPGVEVVFEQKAEIVPASPVGASDKFWPAIESTFKSFEQEISIETFPGATDSRFIRGIGVPAYGISPFTRTPILLHDHNEYLRKDEFLRGVSIYEALIKNLASA